jgi:predicted anti-sigma-YlaC factor YlaD
MPCTEFEELLTDYETLGAVERARVDAHLARCEACRGWREAFVEADTALRATYAGMRAPASLAAYVRQRIPHPAAGAGRKARVSVVPEILDFIAWTGVLCACGVLAYFWMPRDAAFSHAAFFAVSGLLLCVTLSATIWVLGSSES